VWAHPRDAGWLRGKGREAHELVDGSPGHEAIDHSPTTRHVLRKRLAEAGLEANTRFPEDGEVVDLA